MILSREVCVETFHREAFTDMDLLWQATSTAMIRGDGFLITNMTAYLEHNRRRF